MMDCALIFLRMYSLLFANTGILFWFTTGKWFGDESLVDWFTCFSGIIMNVYFTV